MALSFKKGGGSRGGGWCGDPPPTAPGGAELLNRALGEGGGGWHSVRLCAFRGKGPGQPPPAPAAPKWEGQFMRRAVQFCPPPRPSATSPDGATSCARSPGPVLALLRFAEDVQREVSVLARDGGGVGQEVDAGLGLGAREEPL